MQQERLWVSVEWCTARRNFEEGIIGLNATQLERCSLKLGELAATESIYKQFLCGLNSPLHYFKLALMSQST